MLWWAVSVWVQGVTEKMRLLLGRGVGWWWCDLLLEQSPCVVGVKESDERETQRCEWQAC